MDPSTQADKPLKWVNTRLTIEDYQRLQEVAERLFEGNVSMVLRAAIREFVAEREQQTAVAS